MIGFSPSGGLVSFKYIALMVVINFGLSEPYRDLISRLLAWTAFLYQPNWEELGSVIRVSFVPHTYTTDARKKPLPTKLQKLPERQQNVLAHLKKHKKLSAKELASHLIPEVSERSVRGDLLTLKKLSLVELIGKGPNSLWKAINNS